MYSFCLLFDLFIKNEDILCTLHSKDFKHLYQESGSFKHYITYP